MKKSQYYAGLVCFVLSAILFFVDGTKCEFMAGSTNVIIYPAMFLVMLGVLLVVISRRKPAS